MKILVITSWYPDDNNPVQGIFVQEQAKALSVEYDVVVVSFKVDKKQFSLKPSVRNSKIQNGRLTEYRLLINRFLPVVNQFSYMYMAAQFVGKLMKEQQFDLIHAHVAYPAGVVAEHLAGLFKIPYIITEHSSPFESLFKSKIHKYLALKALKNASEIIAVSDYTAKRMRDYIAKDAKVVYNIVSTSSFKADNKTQSDKTVIGFAGMLTSVSPEGDKKGLDILLKSLAALQRRDWILSLVGDGPLLAVYKEMAAALGLTANIQFNGALKPNEMPSFFQSIDFFVLSSRDESFGIVLIEAMSSGKPVVATRCGGPEEIVTDAAGLLCNKEDVEALSRTVNRMLDTYTDYKPENIRNYVEKTFSEEAFRTKMNTVYTPLLKQKS